MFGNDLNWIVSGVAAAILLPVLALIGVPFVIAAIIAAVAFAGLVVFLSPRRLFEGIDIAAVGRDKVAFARELLADAVPAADRLNAAGSRIDDISTKGRVVHLAQIARDVFAKVEANPAGATAVKRFLSYYLPRAAEIAEGYAVLEDKRAPDPAKLTEVKSVIERLEDAFVHYADSLADRELGSLDIDLRLVQASLKEDLGR
jgi:5-bromo-4-chloroindolyl phosphate hydrolysis protein